MKRLIALGTLRGLLLVRAGQNRGFFLWFERVIALGTLLLDIAGRTVVAVFRVSIAGKIG